MNADQKLRRLVLLLACVLYAPLAQEQMGQERRAEAQRRYVLDWALLFGVVGSVTGVGSLIMSMFADRRAIRDEMRLQRAEARASTDDEVRRRAALYLIACERAAGSATDVKNRNHPEWRQLSVGLEEGFAADDHARVIYYRANYQRNAHTIGESSIATTWYKWYIGVHEWTDLDVYAIFGELPRLLRRPGNLQFELDDGVPDWVRKQMPDCRVVGFMYKESTLF